MKKFFLGLSNVRALFAIFRRKKKANKHEENNLGVGGVNLSKKNDELPELSESEHSIQQAKNQQKEYSTFLIQSSILIDSFFLVLHIL